MFKCTVCQKLHQTHIDYCDCGNDTFEEIAGDKSSSYSNTNLVPDIMSGVIFASCILLSCYVIFFTGPKEIKSAPKPVSQEVQNQTADIPDIDSIWNNSLPASAAIPSGGSEIQNYKQALQHTLYSNLETKNIDGDGECEIEFRISRDGKLTNRKMYKKDGGKNFNSIVLNMLKATSEYKTPPADYTGEKIKAYVYTDNGQIKLFIK